MITLTPETLAPPGRSRRRRKTAELEARTRAVGDRLAAISSRPAGTALAELGVTYKGLTQQEAARRLHRLGPNVVAQQRVPHWTIQLVTSFRNPFIVVLACLAAVMCISDPADPGVLILTTMVLISGLLRFWQEHRSARSARALTALVSTTTAVRRRPSRHATPVTAEVPLDDVVPGDIVHLAAGDLVPADLRLLTAKDLMVSQAALSGESLPVAKADTREGGDGQSETTDPVEADNLCLMGTSVTSGTAAGVVVATGADTYFGSMAGSLSGERPETSFDVGVRKVSFLLIRFMLVMVPVVFAINGLTKHDWAEAFMFAVAVAVGLTPEMLPMVVTTNLARGAVAMARHKVVVKKLNAIQNLGAMDVLCTDKTGTLTEDRIVLDRCLDVHGREDDEVLQYAYLNSHFQTGLRNLLDKAVIDHVHEAEEIVVDAAFTKVDEVPFDFERRCMSVVLARTALTGRPGDGQHILISKGAAEEILARCLRMRDGSRTVALTDELRQHVTRVCEDNNRQGLRVLAVATRTFPGDRDTYGVDDESELTLVGFLAFLDPPKRDAAAALRGLADKGIAVKVVTGDNELVAARVCADVGIDVGDVVTGSEIDAMDDALLRECVARNTVFAKVNPVQKARIVRAVQADGHTVGFLGDGINDAAALRESDVGISVDTAVDIAKESADIILLKQGVRGHHPAQEGHDGPGARRTAGQGDVRQHHQVHQDDGQLELRQCLLGAGGQRVHPVPADAGDPAAGAEPGVRHLTARDPLGPDGPGIPAKAPHMGSEGHRTLHAADRPHQLDLRHDDLPAHVARLRRRQHRPPDALPVGMVHRGTAVPDADRAHDPYEEDPLHPVPGLPAGPVHDGGRHGVRCLPAVLTAGFVCRDAGATAGVLPVADRHPARLLRAHPAGEDVVRAPVRRLVVGVAGHVTVMTTDR